MSASNAASYKPVWLTMCCSWYRHGSGCSIVSHAWEIEQMIAFWVPKAQLCTSSWVTNADIFSPSQRKCSDSASCRLGSGCFKRTNSARYLGTVRASLLAFRMSPLLAWPALGAKLGTYQANIGVFEKSCKSLWLFQAIPSLGANLELLRSLYPRKGNLTSRSLHSLKIISSIVPTYHYMVLHDEVDLLLQNPGNLWKLQSFVAQSSLHGWVAKHQASTSAWTMASATDCKWIKWTHQNTAHSWEWLSFCICTLKSACVRAMKYNQSLKYTSHQRQKNI